MAKIKENPYAVSSIKREKERRRDLKEREKKRIQQQKVNTIKSNWIDEDGLKIHSLASNKTMNMFKKKIGELIKTKKKERTQFVQQTLCNGDV